jgi:hypothetical protein
MEGAVLASAVMSKCSHIMFNHTCRLDSDAGEPMCPITLRISPGIATFLFPGDRCSVMVQTYLPQKKSCRSQFKNDPTRVEIIENQKGENYVQINT